MTQRQYDHLLRRLPNVQATWVGSARHAYCTSLSQCKDVTSVLAGILEEEEGRFESQSEGGHQQKAIPAEGGGSGAEPSEWTIAASTVEVTISKI